MGEMTSKLGRVKILGVKKVILIILVFLSIVALTIRYGAKPLGDVLGIQSRAGLRVESNKGVKVFINGEEVGNTPYQNDNLATEDLLVALKQEEGSSSGTFSWQGYVKLSPGTLTVVNRELASTQEDSSGEVISLEGGKGATVISTPLEAEVLVDGVSRGRTPLSISDLTPGEHQFIISRDNFLKRSIRATAVSGFNLVLTVDLAISEPDLTKLPAVPISASAIVVVKQTPTGFLRVRAQANTNASEVAQVEPGDELVLLEETPNWDRVRLDNGKEGWVSSSYVEKKSSP